jgi:hypothetical protein
LVLATESRDKESGLWRLMVIVIRSVVVVLYGKRKGHILYKETSTSLALLSDVMLSDEIRTKGDMGRFACGHARLENVQ